MESYLMMLYVTLEQESALKTFFVDQGWTFCKPDLSITTDRLGPCVRDVLDSNATPKPTGKRKARLRQQQAPVVKLAKISTAPMPTKLNETFSNVQAVTEDSEQLDELIDAELEDTDDLEDNNAALQNSADFKIKVETPDLSYSKDDEYDDGDDDDTDVDYSYEEANIESEMKADITENSGDEVENEVSATDGPTTAEATEIRETKAVKKKTPAEQEKEESVPKCVTCKHFENQAMILDKGPGIPDKGEDEPNVFICDVCGKQFTHQNTYRKHVRSHEVARPERGKKWKCNDCEKIFGSEGNLREHIGQVHLKNPGEFMCHLCPKSYTRSTRLEGHLNSHYGIKPYSCKSCSTQFYAKSTLIAHQKKCEGGLTVRFKCQFCLEFFGSQTELKQHRTEEHANVFCFAPCGRKIRWKSSLKKHTASCVKCKDIETANIISGI